MACICPGHLAVALVGQGAVRDAVAGATSAQRRRVPRGPARRPALRDGRDPAGLPSEAGLYHSPPLLIDIETIVDLSLTCVAGKVAACLVTISQFPEKLKDIIKTHNVWRVWLHKGRLAVEHRSTKRANGSESVFSK